MQDDATSAFHQLEVSSTLARIRRLQVDRSYRDRHGMFSVEGVRNFIAALDHCAYVETLFYSEKLLINTVARKLVRRLKRASVPFARLTPEEFRSVSQTERASGVGAILRQQILTLNRIDLNAQRFWTALSHIRSPGNLGSLVRTSAAIGASGFILLGDSIDPYDPNVVRASMGAFFRQRIVRSNTDELNQWKRANDIQVIGASPDGEVEYDRLRYKPPGLLMLGAERSGLSDRQQSICDHIVRVPMVNGVDSLNVAVAGALLMYEMFRSS